jgi:hypothetical protein
MKKLRTIKPIPGIPVGTVLEWNTVTDSYLVNTPRNGPTRNGSTLAMQADILDGFVEEIKEPEEFWFLHYSGVVMKVSSVIGGRSVVPSWQIFRTKESAEKFALGLKQTHGNEFENVTNIWRITSALNYRVE